MKVGWKERIKRRPEERTEREGEGKEGEMRSGEENEFDGIVEEGGKHQTRQSLVGQHQKLSFILNVLGTTEGLMQESEAIRFTFSNLTVGLA